MHKIICTIVITCYLLGSLRAQTNSFEYKDTMLLNEPGNAATSDTASYQEPVDEEPDILSDTTLYISTIEISPDTIRALKRNQRFAYITNLDSLLKDKQSRELAALKKGMQKKKNSFLQRVLSSGIIQGFFWTIAIAFVLFILYRLFLIDAVFKRSSTASPIQLMPETTPAPVTVSDYDKLIHQSCKLGDYRMAVRWLFLKTLAQLTEQEYLQLSADKTNSQYVQEISADKKNDFAALVLSYEYVWYGNFPLSQEIYTGIEKNSFHSLSKCK